MKQRDLLGVRQFPAGVRGVVVALKPGPFSLLKTAGGAKDSRKMDGVMTRQSESKPADHSASGARRRLNKPDLRTRYGSARNRVSGQCTG
jgi:hypothetical protein